MLQPIYFWKDLFEKKKTERNETETILLEWGVGDVALLGPSYVYLFFDQRKYFSLGKKSYLKINNQWLLFSKRKISAMSEKKATRNFGFVAALRVRSRQLI